MTRSLAGEDELAALARSCLPAGSRFGVGCLGTLADTCRDLGMHRPLLVTDSGLANSALSTEISRGMAAAGIAASWFTGFRGNPSFAQVSAGVAVCTETDHDGVVAIGGGSALDAGKAIAFAATQVRPLTEFALDARASGSGGQPEPEPEAQAPLPWIAVPTTAGSGSEVSPSAVLTSDGASPRKRSVSHSALYAPRVLADPAATVGLPPALTAWTGIDAMSHCLEAWLSPVDDPVADRWAVRGLQYARRSLVPAVQHGDDLDARAAMLMVSTLGASAFRKGLGAVHALSHPLSTCCGLQHGLANAVLLPWVLEHGRPLIDGRLSELARALELVPASPAAVIEWLRELLALLSIPPSLSALDVGWNAEELGEMCRWAQQDANARTNPWVLDAAAAATIYNAARYGDRGRA